jgi:hypothetical protein
MVYNICSLSLDAKQVAFSARPAFQEMVVEGLTGRGPVRLFLCGPGAVTYVFTPHME